MKFRHLVFLLAAAACGPGAAQSAVPGTSAEAQAVIERLGLHEGALPMAERPGWRPRKVVVSAPRMFMGGVPDYVQRLQAVAGEVELVVDESGAMNPPPELLEGADAYIGFCSAPLMQQVSDRFLWLHSYLVGMDACAGLAEDVIGGRVFSNSKRLSGPSIADHTIAMMLSLARALPAFHRAQLEPRWDRAPAADMTFGELEGKTLLVVGLGGIGTEVARRAHGLGMRVIATRRSSREGPEFVDKVGLSSELSDLASEADVVVNALPLTAETTALFDKEFFALLPRGAMFISVGRGKSTVTADLIAALESGHLYGAGLDVTDPEPLPPESPLWTMPNVVVTPHISAAGIDSIRRNAVIAVENLRRYVAGEALLNEVDMAAGY